MKAKENRGLIWMKKQAQDQRGLGLVETLVAVAILGTSVVAFVVALSTGSIAVGQQDEEVVAQGLAQAQLEYTKSYAYNAGASTYPTIAAPEGYNVSLVVSSVPNTDADIQKISANILRDGESILIVEDYKVNR
jgi:type II secretory pathway pseudopilin PulG